MYPTCMWLILALLALNMAAFVLVQEPRPGVADQGDFDRVMNVSGLELPARDADDGEFVRFLDYPVTDYHITAAGPGQLFSRVKATSISYLITLIGLICRALGQETFKTSYLAFVYAALYLSALLVIVRYMDPGGPLKQAGLALLAWPVLLDGNYLVWFNSLYGEPMMIVTLLLYIAAWVYYIHRRHVQPATGNRFVEILLIMAAAHLFLGSKLQVISALPVILAMLVLLIRANWSQLNRTQAALVLILLGMVAYYPIQINMHNRSIGELTKYNSVFYGILKDSPDPAADLIDLGLNPDMAVEAGKHAFQARGDYIKYAPSAALTRSEFYDRIGNLDLIRFYVTHPARLLQGMEYTAGQAFTTATWMGKYSREYSLAPVREFERLTGWSRLRQQLPPNLAFITLVFLGVMAVSLRIYRQNRGRADLRARMALLWAVMAIGILQFPMPLAGNGYADTAKQLFLFNFVFDLVLVVAAGWCLDQALEWTSSWQHGWRARRLAYAAKPGLGENSHE
ncbi:MAG: hypothetical protein ABRQ24_05930 [Syntrophomonadaceae bacterium]